MTEPWLPMQGLGNAQGLLNGMHLYHHMCGNAAVVMWPTCVESGGWSSPETMRSSFSTP